MQQIKCDPCEMLYSIAQSLHEKPATTFEELKERCAPLGIVNRSRNIVFECKKDMPIPLFSYKGAPIKEKRGDSLVISLEAPIKAGDPVVVATQLGGIIFGNLFPNPLYKDFLVLGGIPFTEDSCPLGPFIVIGKIVRVIRSVE